MKNGHFCWQGVSLVFGFVRILKIYTGIQINVPLFSDARNLKDIIYPHFTSVQPGIEIVNKVNKLSNKAFFWMDKRLLQASPLKNKYTCTRKFCCSFVITIITQHNKHNLNKSIVVIKKSEVKH